jgi:hypothetical protein
VGDVTPGPADEVTIAPGGNVTIRISSEDVTIRHLNLQQDLLVTGSIEVHVTQGMVATTGHIITVVTGEMLVEGDVSIPGVSLIAEGGGSVELRDCLELTFPGPSSRIMELIARGDGSRLLLPSVHTAQGGTSRYYQTEVQALQGGRIEMNALVQVLNGSFAITADGANSTVSMENLSSFDGHFDGTRSGFYPKAEGTIYTPKLISVRDGDLLFSGGGYMPTAQIEEISGFGTLTIADSVADLSSLEQMSDGDTTIVGVSQTFPALTNIDGRSIRVSDGAVVTLDGVVSYSNPPEFTYDRVLLAQGAGSILSFPHVQTIAGTTARWDNLILEAIDGGRLVFSEARQVSQGAAVIRATGSDSVIQLDSLQSFYGYFNATDSGFYAQLGGEILAPNLTVIQNANMTFDGTGMMSTSQIEEISESGVLTISGQPVDFSSLLVMSNGTTNINGVDQTFPSLVIIDGRAIHVTGGVEVTMPNVVSYRNTYAPYVVQSLSASGPGTVLSFPAMLTLQGSTVYAVNTLVEARNGGHVDMSSVTHVPNGAIMLRSEGIGSRISLDSLLTFDGHFSDYNASITEIYAGSGGTIHTPNLVSIRDASLLFDGSGVMPTAQLRSIEGAGILTIENAEIDLSSLEVMRSGSTTIRRANQEFPSLVSIDGRSFDVSGGANVVINGVTAFSNTRTFQGDHLVWRVSGPTTQLSLPNLITIQGAATYNVEMHIQAEAGGHINLSGVRQILDGATVLRVDGIDSELDLRHLESFDGWFYYTDSGIYVYNRGSILLGVNAPAISVRDANIVVQARTTFATSVLELLGNVNFSGSGTILGSIQNSGDPFPSVSKSVFRPGGSAVAGLTIDGNFSQGQNGLLELNIQGLVPDLQHDRMRVTGEVSLGGELSVVRDGNYVPFVGTSLEVLTFATSSGDFSKYTGLAIDATVSLSPTFHSESLTLDAKVTDPPEVLQVSMPYGSILTSDFINLDVTFSEPVFGVDATDVRLSGTANSYGAIVRPPSHLGNNVWRFPIVGLTSGELTVTIAPDADDILDVAGGYVSRVVVPYTVALASQDFGDAPASYGVRVTDDGARHAVGTLFLGATIDAESNGLPHNTALGDDNNQGDDEDGVVFNGPVVAGSPMSVTVQASRAGFVDAWLDINRDGDFHDAREHIFISAPVTAGPNTLVVDLPYETSVGNSFVRFRISSAGGLDPNGAAPDGEVEDYNVTITPAPWRNPNNALDVNGDLAVTYSDVQTILDRLEALGSSPVPTLPSTPPPFYDVNGDADITPTDALIVANSLTTGNGILPGGSLAELKVTVFDLNGRPATSIPVGADFLVRVTAKDLRPDGQGIAGAYADVTYNANLARALSLSPGTGYTFLAHGSTATVGLVDEAGGMLESLATPPGPNEFVLWQATFRADRLGQTALLPRSATGLGHGILMFGMDVPAPNNQVVYTGTTIDIVPVASEPVIPPTNPNDNSGDAYRIVRNGQYVELFVDGEFSESFRYATLNRMSVFGSGDDDTMTIDLSGGNPIPAGGFTFDGGIGGINVLRVIGSDVEGLEYLAGATDIQLSLVAGPGITGLIHADHVSSLEATDFGLVRVTTLGSQDDIAVSGAGANARLTGNTDSNTIVPITIEQVRSLAIDTGSNDRFFFNDDAVTLTGNLSNLADLQILTGQGNDSVLIDNATIVLAGELQLEGRTVSLESVDSEVTLLNAGYTTLPLRTTLENSVLSVPNGIIVPAGGQLMANGEIRGKFYGDNASKVTLTGDLVIGDASSPAGFVTNGELDVAAHQLTILDASLAVLGTTTRIGQGATTGQLVSDNGVLVDDGTELIGTGSIVTVDGVFDNQGVVRGLGTGIVFDNLVVGDGDFSGMVTFNGGYSPGNSPARVEFNGSVAFGGDNNLVMEIAGIQLGRYDQLAVTDSVSLDGSLTVQLLDGYLPEVGHEFELVAVGGTVHGSFDHVQLPALPPGLAWNFDVSDVSAVLRIVASSESGDFNGDGNLDLSDLDRLVRELAQHGSNSIFDVNHDQAVDQADLGEWLSTAGQRNLGDGLAYLKGDANLDGIVDGIDFGIWQSHRYSLVAAWSAGDFNADGAVDASDFNLWNKHKFLVSASPAVAGSSIPRRAPQPASSTTPAMAAVFAPEQFMNGANRSSGRMNVSINDNSSELEHDSYLPFVDRRWRVNSRQRRVGLSDSSAARDTHLTLTDLAFQEIGHGERGGMATADRAVD